MAKGKRADDLTTLEMALVGYQVEKQKIEAKIQEIRSLLKGKSAPASASGEEAAPRARRELSDAARKRIAAAQRKRWSEHRKRKAQGQQQ
jgi:hypothetical protein